MQGIEFHILIFFKPSCIFRSIFFIRLQVGQRICLTCLVLRSNSPPHSLHKDLISISIFYPHLLKKTRYNIHMSKLHSFISSVISAFKVEDWESEIKFTKQSGNADMQIDHRYKRYTLRIHRGFFKADLRYQASTIIHEFCHFFNLPVANLLRRSVEGQMVTIHHLDDVMENANVHAENVLISILEDESLKKAFNEYINPKKRRSVKRGSKLTQKK